MASLYFALIIAANDVIHTKLMKYCYFNKYVTLRFYSRVMCSFSDIFVGFSERTAAESLVREQQQTLSRVSTELNRVESTIDESRRKQNLLEGELTQLNSHLCGQFISVQYSQRIRNIISERIMFIFLLRCCSIYY